MQLFHRIGATILLVIVLVSITASCFATPVTVTGIDFFTAAFQTFIEICGLTTVLTSNSVNSSSNDPYSQLQLTDQYQSLYDEYQTTLQSQESMSDWYSTYKDSIILNVDSQTSIISPTIDAQLSEWFSGFAGWILEDKYNCTRTDSGFSHSSGTFDSPLISTNDGLSIDGIGLPFFSGGNDLDFQFQQSDFGIYNYRLSTDSGYTVYAYFDSANNSICCVSFARSPVFFKRFYNNDWQTFTSGWTSEYVRLGDTYYVISKTPSASGVIGIPALPYGFTSIPSDVVVSSTDNQISLRPKDKYNEDAIPVPNVESNTYIPQALEGEYSDVITGALEGVQNPTLNDILQAVLDAVTENEEVIAEERVEPAPVNPVMPPFMPFDLPSFDFNLSGIWYYVTRWVNSIGNGVSLFFSIWSNIPPAMFYPVFGSAVVVIVIGVWKRFIA